MKNYEVAVLKNKQGKSILALKCKMVDEEEYNKLTEETLKLLDEKDNQIKELKLQLNNLGNVVNRLVNDIKLLKGEE